MDLCSDEHYICEVCYRIVNKELWKKTGEKPALQQLGRRNVIGLVARREEVLTASASRCFSNTTRLQREKATQEYLDK